jgi:hypothetical protein
MRVLEGTDLPDDFFQKGNQQIGLERRKRAQEPPFDPVYAVLGRSLTHQEKMAIVDALHAATEGGSTWRSFAQ